MPVPVSRCLLELLSDEWTAASMGMQQLWCVSAVVSRVRAASLLELGTKGRTGRADPCPCWGGAWTDYGWDGGGYQPGADQGCDSAGNGLANKKAPETTEASNWQQ
jgi:hypothetical protein